MAVISLRGVVTLHLKASLYTAPCRSVYVAARIIQSTNKISSSVLPSAGNAP